MSRRPSSIAVVVGLLLAVVTLGRAHEPKWTLAPEGRAYSLETYTTADGLPQNSINDILQTRDGYLWLATFGGVARFDGVSFEVFDTIHSPGLASNRILSLHQSRDDAIWVGFQEGGVARYADREFRTFSDENGAPTSSVLDIAEGEAGTIWFASTAGVYLRRPEGTFERFDERQGVSTRGASALLVEGETAWIGRMQGHDFPGGLLLHREDRLEQVLSDAPGMHAIFRDRGGELWLGTVGGARLLGHDGNYSTLGATEVASFSEDVDGNVWSAGEELLRFEREGGVARPLGPPPLPYDLTSVLADAGGSIWLGSRGGGLLRLRPRSVERLTLRDGLPVREIRTITGDGDGGLWLAGACSGLTRFHAGGFETLEVKAGQPGCVSALLLDRDGILWFVGDQRLCRLEGRKPICGEANADIGAILQDSAGRIWVAARRGLLFLDGEQLTPVPLPEQLAPARVQALVESRSGTLWIGTAGGLLAFADGGYRLIPTTEGKSVRDVYEDSDGTAWIATYGHGLGRMAGGEIAWVTTREGLQENFVSRILEDDHGYLWLNGNLGLTRVSRAELSAQAEGSRQTVFAALLGEHEGAAEGTGGAQPAGWESPDGRLWFPTIDGVVSIDPRQNPRAGLPNVVIESVRVDRRAHPPDAAVRIAPGAHEVEIDYTAPGLLYPEFAQFRYRLEGYDKEWVSAGDRRTAYYSGVRPGSYTFEVLAGSGGGLWSPDAAAVRLEFAPPLWRTWWFRTLAAVVLAGLLLTGYRYRTRGIRERNRLLAAEIEQRTVAEAKLRSVFDSVPVVLFALDRDGVFTVSEGRGLRSLNLRPGEVVGRSAFEVYAGESSIEDNLRRGLAGEEREWTTQVGGAWFHSRVTPMRDETGAVTGLIGVGMDITDRKTAEDERARMENELRQQQKLDAVGQLAGGVAHDFNNLLTVIAGHAEVLSENPALDATARNSLKEIRHAQDSAASLTRRLLAFSRQQVLRPEVLDLNAVLRGVHEMMGRVIGEHIDLILDLSAGLPSIQADRGQIEQVVLNLLVNARDALGQGGRITISTSEVAQPNGLQATDASTGWVELTVRDNGCGMSDEVRDRIFEPFFTTKLRGRGTGLGLSTVFGIVEQSNGRIECETTEGVGTVFRIRFPATAAAAGLVRRDPRQDVMVGGSETILVAEDDEPVRVLIERVLENLGYRVLAARDGASAVRTAKEHEGKVDLLLTDLVMPGLTGPELADELRGAFPELRVLFMSGYAHEPLPGMRLLDADDRFLPKPFNGMVLARTVRELLDGRS